VYSDSIKVMLAKCSYFRQVFLLRAKNYLLKSVNVLRSYSKNKNGLFLGQAVILQFNFTSVPNRLKK